MKKHIFFIILCTYNGLLITADQKKLNHELMTTILFHRVLQDTNLPLNRSYAAVRSLLEKKANTDTRDKHGNTPLHYATKFQDIPLVELLLEHNPRIDTPNQNGHTPFLIAFQLDDQKLASILSGAGASANPQSYIMHKKNVVFKIPSITTTHAHQTRKRKRNI